MPRAAYYVAAEGLRHLPHDSHATQHVWRLCPVHWKCVGGDGDDDDETSVCAGGVGGGGGGNNKTTYSISLLKKSTKYSPTPTAEATNRRKNGAILGFWQNVTILWF